MRFRHGELEGLRQDVSAWVAKKKVPTTGPRMSYKHATRMGIYRLHRGDSVSSAAKYLDEFLDSYSLKSAQKRAECEADLYQYARWMKDEALTSLLTKTRLQTEVATDIYIGGEIPRIDLLPTGGYRAILLGDDSGGWRDELRMPIIQRAVARVLKRSENLVSVGVQAIDGGGLESTSFSKAEIEEARRELIQLDAQARALLGH
jgi:hypothetical protein